MILAITSRYNEPSNDEIWRGSFYIGEYFKDIFEKLNVLLFPVVSTKNLEKVADICDGLVVIGRPIDVNPKYYDEELNEKTNLDKCGFDDKLDFAVIKAFSRVDKPILGICAGIQSINVCFGGKLYQDIPDHSIKNGIKMHNINIEKGSNLEKIYNSNNVEVNSFHHQAISKIAKGFRIVAKSDDGIIEAIEYKNILGVQWHPEQIMDIEFFKKYLELYFYN